MKVLLDRNIERNAITHKTVLAPHKISWGPSESILRVAERAHLPPRADEDFRMSQLPFLAALCDHARSGRFEFFTSPELTMEKLRQKGCDQGYLGFSMLDGIKMRQVASPIRRVVVIGSGANIGLTKAEQLEFFRATGHPRLLAIRRLVGDAHIDDGYHLWTAEQSSLEAFLTMDKRFWMVVRQKEKLIGSTVRVTTPKELSEMEGLEPMQAEELASRNNPFA